MAALDFAKRPVVLFDFDGTLVNTGGAVISTVTRVLSAHGFSQEEMGDLRTFDSIFVDDGYRKRDGRGRRPR